jgi:7,8-dihydropterin-6-yl-methyl-4-(beta-D-ribofuranosyl)aminobenzene 5'-phosphate synthase
LTQKPGLPLYASPDIFRPRFSVRNGKYNAIGLPLAQGEIAQLADLRLNSGPVEVLPGLWTTGEIEERPEPEGRSPRHVIPHGDSWKPDPYRDDMSLVMETPAGLVVICGCCHAGLLNTLAHVRRTFRGPIVAVIGGTHLIEADEAHLEHVVELLRHKYESPQLYLNHCTGERAYLYLAKAFGEQVNSGSVGTTLTFD